MELKLDDTFEKVLYPLVQMKEDRITCFGGFRGNGTRSGQIFSIADDAITTLTVKEQILDAGPVIYGDIDTEEHKVETREEKVKELLPALQYDTQFIPTTAGCIGLGFNNTGKPWLTLVEDSRSGIQHMSFPVLKSARLR